MRSHPRIFRAAFCLLAMTIGGLVPLRSGHAFSLEGPRWGPNSAVVLSLQLGTNDQSMPLLDGSPSFDVVGRQAANLWNIYLGSGVRFAFSQGGTAGGSLDDEIHSLFFSNTEFGDPFPGSVLASTSYLFDTSVSPPMMVRADIVFNKNFSWNSYRGPQLGAVDFRRVAIHELGHMLGLAHPNQAGQSVVAIMNSTITNLDVMQADDINGIRALYGTSPPAPTPTPPPVPLGNSQTLSSTYGHVYSSPGDPVGGGVEATLDAAHGYGTAYYRHEETDGVGRTLHRIIFPQNGSTPSATEWAFTFSLPAGQQLTAGTYLIAASDATSASKPYVTVAFGGLVSTLTSGRLKILDVSYSGSTLVRLAADFQLTQSSTAAAPKFLAGQIRFNTAVALPSARLTNISTRVAVSGTGQSQAIAGFLVADPSGVGKEAVVRALGPTLTTFGVPGVLADPVATLYAGGTVLMQNDDWLDFSSVPNGPQAPAVTIGLAPGARLESVLFNRFSVGGYTTVVYGLDTNNTPGASGIALLEVYDLEIGSDALLTNVSTRGPVGVGANVMIGGFIIQGPGTKKVIIRAIGPSLAPLGVTGVLQNPTVSVYNSAGQVIAQNDNWQSDPNAATVSTKNLAPGNPQESAIYLVLNPGAYTAIVSGVGATTGIGLVEIYDAD